MLKNIAKIKRLSFGKLAKYLLIISAIAITLIYLLANSVKSSQASADQAITDQNGDGIINLADARIISPPATTSCPVCVDVNGDKKITQMDVDLVKYYAGLGDSSQGSRYIYKSRMDVNNDGTLSQGDVDIVQNYLGQTVTAPAFGLDDPSELTYGFKANDVFIKFKPGAAGTEKGFVASKHNLVYKESFHSTADYYTSLENNVENLQKQLKAEPSVEKTYKNYTGESATNDPRWNEQWGMTKIRIPETWFTETTGSTSNPVKVVVLDTGVDVNHPDLQQNISSIRINATLDDPHDPDFENVTDLNGHGTFMAGIIGATADNNIGIAGVAQHVEIIPIKFHTNISDSESIPDVLALERGFYLATLIQGVKVINMSFCMGYMDSSMYLPTDDLEVARQIKNITLVASAGNDGRDDSCYPARNENVVSVGATTPLDYLWDFSNGRQDADVFAPGNAIVSTTPGGGTYTNSGTSTSTAFISGIAALCRTVRPMPESNESTRSDLACNIFDKTGFGRVDAWSTIWNKNCFKFDFNNDGKISSLDAQALAFRYGTSTGNPLYNTRYDIKPVGTDGTIDYADALQILNRTGLNCPQR